MQYKVELIVDIGEELLEGPVFDKVNNTLYFVSILDNRVYRFIPSTRQLTYIQLGSPTSCIFPSSEFGIVVATTLGFYTLDFGTLSAHKLFDVDIASNLRFNDGRMDEKERFLIGTMGYPEIIQNAGSLLSYSGGKVKSLISDTTISNGLVFSHDSKKMFFIDTPTRAVKEYNYDLETGSCEFCKELIFFTEKGVPDGMDIDHKGNLWIAEWGGYCVSVWNPLTGEKIWKIEIPMENVTSVCFDNDENLFVTTARSNVNGEEKGGAVFYVKIRRDA